MSVKKNPDFKSVWRYFVVPFIDFVYPPICFHCKRTVESGEFWCRQCDKMLQPVGVGSETHLYLRNMLVSDKTPIQDVYALYEFEREGPLQTLIHELKYQQKTEIGVEFGKRLGKAAQAIFGVDDTWILIPVPLHPAKERERGYNQAYHIARGIQEATGADLTTDLIHRQRNTRTQTTLTKAERQENVHGAFECDDRLKTIEKSPIALIDDVLTTGATMTSIARLFPAGARVYALSIGYAPLHVFLST